MKQIADFFRNFFPNAKNDVMSTIKGGVQIIVGGTIYYSIMMKILPQNPETLGIASALIVSGIHSIGTNCLGNGSEIAAKIDNIVAEITAKNAPTVLDIVEQIGLIKQQAEDGQKKVELYQNVTASLAEIVTPKE